ncbi:MAG TPA: hypothetical protein VE962_06800 [Actinomycetota bacterium]|nr:hypothetical protein [Actinomycetota bacterium]
MGSIAVRRLVLAGLVGLLVAGSAPAAQAHRTALSVQILSEQSLISPDGRSMTFDIETTCDRRWTIVEATASVTQAGASGSGPFTPTCGRIPYVTRVTVPASGAPFHTGSAQASVVLVVGNGPDKRAQDSGSLRVRPDVSIQLANTAALQGDGSVVIDATVTCPMSAVGLGGNVRIFDGVTGGEGAFGPTPCDALPHTFSVRVSPAQGGYRPASAETYAFASIEEGGDVFTGFDIRTIQIVAA